MNRTGLFIALAVGIVTGVLFGFFPKLDLEISDLWFDHRDTEFFIIRDLAHGEYAWLAAARKISMWVVVAIAAPSAVALVIKFLVPSRRLLVSGRAIVFLLATLAIGPGLTTNVLLKDHWGRPRPIDIGEFGGDQHFTPWWDPRGDCPANCSFIGGEASGAFWTLAPAALAPAQWRPLAYGAAVAFGAAVSGLRIAFGGHFFSDVVFAGVFTCLIVWVAYGLLYRWQATALSDEAIERAIERIVLPIHAVLGRLFARLASLVRRQSIRPGQGNTL